MEILHTKKNVVICILLVVRVQLWQFNQENYYNLNEKREYHFGEKISQKIITRKRWDDDAKLDPWTNLRGIHESCIQNLVGKPLEKRQLEGPRQSWKDTIKIGPC
jgi:hypothetical protein